MAALDRPGDAPDGTPGATTRSRPEREITTGAGSGGPANGHDADRPLTRAQLLREEARARDELAVRHGQERDAPLDDLDRSIAASGPADEAHAPPDGDADDRATTAAVSVVGVAPSDVPRGAPREGLADPLEVLAEVARTELVPGGPTTVGSEIVVDPNPTPVDGPFPVVVRPAEPVPAPPIVEPRPAKERTVSVRRQRPRVRRVRRVIRSVDAWTVFKVSLIFYAVLMVILLVAGVLLWNLAYATGTIDNLERFFESFGWETFRFHGGQIFHSAWIAGLFLVVAGTGLNVVMATVFNLIADLVGGVGVTVLEEEVRVVPDVQVGSRRGAAEQETG